ncbi:prolyl-tRNA synthetase associated domain-containing protein [Xanthobacteraceae bacterium A53D]
MPLSPDDLLAFLAREGIAAPTITHEPVFTVAEAQALRGEMPGAHTKNLFLRDGKKSFFLVTLGENRVVDLKALRSRIGARGGLSFASPEALFEHLGVRPGAVSLLALANDTERRVTVAIDAALREADFITCHPLTNARTSSLTQAGLDAFLAATGHKLLTLDLDSPESSDA